MSRDIEIHPDTSLPKPHKLDYDKVLGSLTAVFAMQGHDFYAAQRKAAEYLKGCQPTRKPRQ